MPYIKYHGNDYFNKPGESVLDTLLRHGNDIKYSCRNGICKVCRMISFDNDVVEDSRKGLNENQVNDGYFLPCKCYPKEDITCESNTNQTKYSTVLVSRIKMGNNYWILEFTFKGIIDFHAGQFIELEYLGKKYSYTLTEIHEFENKFEIHVPYNGDVSENQWLLDSVDVGQEVYFRLLAINSYYKLGDVDKSLVLVAIDEGAITSLGIIRDAIKSNHKLPIVLLHSAANERGLLYEEFFFELTVKYSNFIYVQCLSETHVAGIFHGSVKDLNPQNIFSQGESVSFISGSNEEVYSVSSLFIAAGFNKSDIRTATYHNNNRYEEVIKENVSVVHEEASYPNPDIELWEALDKGRKLKIIIDDFYDLVFEDKVMSPYFHKSNKKHAKEKVYSFYFRLFSGEKVYFGDRPRNAHHWMVIPSEVYDYREELLHKVLQKHGLSDLLISKWSNSENVFRTDIIKESPRGRIVDGIEIPIAGFSKDTLEVGSVCDGCEASIDAGSEVLYHLRTGKIYCSGCSGSGVKEDYSIGGSPE